jgi:hypothetical protein
MLCCLHIQDKKVGDFEGSGGEVGTPNILFVEDHCVISEVSTGMTTSFWM